MVKGFSETAKNVTRFDAHLGPLVRQWFRGKGVHEYGLCLWLREQRQVLMLTLDPLPGNGLGSVVKHALKEGGHVAGEVWGGEADLCMQVLGGGR